MEKIPAGSSGSDAGRARHAMLDAAQHVFAERGFDAPGLRDVTDRAGVAHGMVRHHFGTKTELWQAVVDRSARRYAAALEPHAEPPADPADALETARSALRGFLEVNARHPEVLRLLMHESVSGGERLRYLLDRLAPIAVLMEPLFSRMRREGYLHQFDQPALLLFLLTAGALPFALPALTDGLLGERLEPGRPAGERHIERILDTIYPRPRP